MASLKLKLCVVLTVIVMALHRVKSQHCQEFITPPVDTVAVLSSFTCLTCDYPDTTQEEWYRDGSIIQGTTDLCDCEVFPDEGRICFDSVSENDVDTYTCEVVIGFSNTRVCGADLILAKSPVIDKTSTVPLNVTDTSTATIPVSVMGLPNPTVQFLKDGTVLSSSSDPRVTISNTGNDWELTISNVNRDDRGDYSIVANNSAGMDTFSRRLLVQFAPVLTVEPKANINNMVTLNCTAIAYPRPFETAVFWERLSDETRLPSTEMFTATDIDFTVTTMTDVDMSACEPEGYRCVVQNSRGLTRQSVTLCSDPPNPPAITVAVLSSTSVRVTWMRVTNPLATNYTIEYRPVGDTGAYMSRTVEEDSDSFSETIGNLLQGTEYEFRAVSANSAGRGGFSQPMTVKLPSGDPVTGVLAVSTTVDNARAIRISWNAYPEPVMEYLIHYTISGEDQTPKRVESDETSFLLTPVECDNRVITYTFQIQAVTLLGEQQVSDTVELDVVCINPAELPLQTVTVQNVLLSGTAITVTWQVTAGANVEGLLIRLSEIDSRGDVKVTKNYTLPRNELNQLSKCVGQLTLKTVYEVCIVANVTGRDSEELDCYESVVRTLEEDVEDVSSCAEPTAVELGSPGPSAEPSSGGIAAWVIAVIVVGVLAIVALVFCLMGVFFACHSNQRKGGAEFGSQSSIHTESLSSNMHIHDHRSMSSTGSCFAHHSQGHSTNWRDHADTLKALESGAPTAV